jgi:hypothetical protein
VSLRVQKIVPHPIGIFPIHLRNSGSDTHIHMFKFRQLTTHTQVTIVISKYLYSHTYLQISIYTTEMMPPGKNIVAIGLALILTTFTNGLPMPLVARNPPQQLPENATANDRE